MITMLRVGIIMGIHSALFGCHKPQKNLNTQAINPNNILFSLATIFDELPAIDKTVSASAPALQLHEDDWRQIEFVGVKNRSPLKQQLAEFISFRDSHRKSLGFTSVYVPLSSTFRNKISSIAAQYGLVLVDWYKGIIIESVNEGSIQQWASLYIKAK
jgi:hypothetical protein